MSEEHSSEKDSQTPVAAVSNRSYLRFIDEIAKISGILLAVLYFSGLLIVNAHLSKFGAARIGLVDSKYIIAGVWYLIFGGICFVMYEEASRLLRQEVPFRMNSLLAMASFFGQLFAVNVLLFFIAERGEKLPQQLNWHTVFVIVFIFVLVSGLTLMIADIVGKKENRFFTILGIISYSAYSVLLGVVLFSIQELIFFLSILLIIRTSRVAIKKYRAQAEIAQSLTGIVIIWLFSLGIFGRFVYAKMSPEFGGGMSIPVEVLLDETISKQENSIFTQSSLKCKLIDRTEDSIVIINDSSGSNKAIEVRRDKILAMNYLDVPLKHPLGINLLSEMKLMSSATKSDTIDSRTGK